MKHLFSLLLFGLLIGLAAAEPKVPQLTGRVVDQAKIFGASGAEKIDAAIRALETATGGGQMAVLTVDTLDGTPIEEFGIRVMDQWKIGRKGKDDGAILIIALRDRAMRLEIGYGWEGDINDARAGDIIRGLAPFFRENRYPDGVLFPVSKSLRDDALILTFSTEKADAALSLLLNCPRSRHSRYSRALISLAKSMFSIRYHLIYAP